MDWDLERVKARVFHRDTVSEALRALADYFEPMQGSATLLAISVEYDGEVYRLTAFWQELPGNGEYRGEIHRLPPFWEELPDNEA